MRGIVTHCIIIVYVGCSLAFQQIDSYYALINELLFSFGETIVHAGSAGNFQEMRR